MKNNLFLIVLALSPWVLANQDDVQIEKIYTNTAAAQQPAEAYDGVDNSGYAAYGENDNESRNSKSSPQVNIYNANTNKNDNDHKQTQDQNQEQDLDASVVAEADSESLIGQEHVMRANQMRKARKHMEVGTEQKMIEKIEYSRIEDEKDRADRLFGNRLDKSYNDSYQQQQPYQPAPAPQPEYKKEETKVIIVEREKDDYDKKDKKDDDYESDAYVAEKSPIKFGWWGQESYISPMIGTAGYASSVNTEGNKALGVAVGSRFESGWGVEAAFIYSDYELSDYNQATIKCNQGVCPVVKDVSQYNLVFGAKYSLPLGMVSPFVGGLLGYTYRDYTGPAGIYQDASATSNSVDAGLNIGADVKVAKNFSIGAEYRWMTNLTYDREDNQTSGTGVSPAAVRFFPSSLGLERKPLEEIDYQMFLINGKFTF